MDTSALSTIHSQTDQKIDYDRELPFKCQRSIETSFGEIYVYTSTADKTKRIYNAIKFMICKDYHSLLLVENEAFKNLLKITAAHKDS